MKTHGRNNSLFAIIIILILFFGLIVYQNIQDKNLKLESSEKIFESDSLDPGFTEEKTFRFENEELGFSFEYPAWFGKPSFEIREAEIGKIFYGYFENAGFEFGGVTEEFQEGRESWPTDFNGSNYWYDSYPIVGNVLVDGKEIDIIGGQGDFSLINPLGDQDFLARLPLNGNEFKGLAVKSGIVKKTADKKKLTLEEFKSVLKTFKIN